MNYPYDDGARQRRIDEAIRHGVVVKHIDPDGMVRYEITNLGMRYAAESAMDRMSREFRHHFGVHL